MNDRDIRRRIADEVPHMRRFAYALTDSRSGADDLLQDSLERALRRTWQWRKTGSLRSWLLRIVYTTHVNTVYRDRRHQGVTLDAVEHTMGQRARQEDVMDCVTSIGALEQLPKDQRDALVLVALEDVGYDEAADILEVPVGTVRSRISRAREALRAALEPPRRRLQRVK